MRRFLILFIAISACLCDAAKKPPEVPTKICGNKECTQTLFTTSFTRNYKSNHESFLNAVEGDEVNIVGIKYTRRSDNLFAEVNGTYGMIFTGLIDTLPYVFFLEGSLKDNNKYYRVQHHDDIKMTNNFVEEVEANPDFYLDYTVYAKNNNVPINDQIVVNKKADEDDHSHHGHSHSHHGHSHSHGGHGHSHSHSHEEKVEVTTVPPPVEIPATTQAPIEVTTPPAVNKQPEEKVEAPSPMEQLVKEEKQEIPTPVEQVVEQPVEVPSVTEKPVDQPVEVKPIYTQEQVANTPPELPKLSDLNMGSILPGSFDTLPTTTVAPIPAEPITVSPTPSLHANAVPLNHEMPVDQKVVEPPKATIPDQQNVDAFIESFNAELNAQQTTPSPPVQVNELPKEVPVEIPTTTTPTPQVSEAPLQMEKPVAHVDPIPQTTEAPVVEEVKHQQTDKSDFCYKENCSKPMNEPNLVQSTAKSIMNGLRSTVPALSFLDDTGIILLSYLIGWAVIYLIGLALSDTKSPDALDRRALFDARTKLKEQEVEIRELRRSVPDRAQQEQLQNSYHEIQRQLQAERQTSQALRARIIDPEVLNEKDRLIEQLKAEKRDQLSQLENVKNDEISKLRAEVKALNDELQIRQDEIAELTAENNELEKTAQLHKETADDLQQKYDEMLVVLSEQKQRQVEESAESDGSGASGGWSNVGNDLDLDAELASEKKDDDESTSSKPVKKQNKSESWSANELKELAKAKVDLRRLEAERDQLNLKLQGSQTEKKMSEERISHLTKETEELRAELKEKKAQIEKREQEASGQREQLNSFLEIIKDKEQKLSRADIEQSQLKDKIHHLEAEVHKSEIVKQQNEQKIKDLEDRIDKAEEMKSKLQNRWFHEERNYTTKIRTLEETISKLQATFNTSYEAPNAASPISERDYGRESDIPDLWSSLSHSQRGAGLGSHNASHTSHNASFQLDTSDEASQQIRLPRQSSHRETPERRRRSRSANRDAIGTFSTYTSGRRSAHQSGRPSPVTSLLQGSVTSPFYERQSGGGLNRPPSTGMSRLPKSASNASNLVYNSDDSTRSPPTEFVARSGVPPSNPASLISKPKGVLPAVAAAPIRLGPTTGLTKRTR